MIRRPGPFGCIHGAERGEVSAVNAIQKDTSHPLRRAILVVCGLALAIGLAGSCRSLGKDQLEDYARRKGISLREAESHLPSDLAY